MLGQVSAFPLRGFHWRGPVEADTYQEVGYVRVRVRVAPGLVCSSDNIRRDPTNGRRQIRVTRRRPGAQDFEVFEKSVREMCEGDIEDDALAPYMGGSTGQLVGPSTKRQLAHYEMLASVSTYLSS